MKESYEKNRAWVEVNLKNLEHNIKEFQKIIAKKAKIMAVVKANAYGHGMIEVARKLEKIGIEDFAVATLDEGITLRKENIKGNILILGTTSKENIEEVVKYDLIQTIVDYEYKKALENLNLKEKIKVHIKINTGMNRIGLDYKEIEKIKEVYESPKLNVLGIFSHLSTADSRKEEDITFTKTQIKRFQDLINKLKQDNIKVGKTHLQSSYGTANYGDLDFDYIRPGILMYGVLVEKGNTPKINLDLKPCLSLKAKVTSIKEIEKGEAVSYGRKYIAEEKETIATLSIGYADGYPRNLSGKNTKVLINDQECEIIGRICMDQLIIKVMSQKVKVGSIATLIGEEKEVRAEEIASKAETITDELLCRLGERLPRIYLQ